MVLPAPIPQANVAGHLTELRAQPKVSRLNELLNELSSRGNDTPFLPSSAFLEAYALTG